MQQLGSVAALFPMYVYAYNILTLVTEVLCISCGDRVMPHLVTS